MHPFKSLLIFLIAINLNNNFCYAEDAVYLIKDNPAPFSGILISTDKAQELRKNTLELDIQKQVNLSLTRSIDLYKNNELLYDKKIETLTDYNSKLSEALYKANNGSTVEKIVYFGLGAVLTGFASYGIYKAAVAK